MNKLVDLVIFVVVAGVLWWALQAVLAAFHIGEPISTLVVVAFVVIAVLALVDYVRGGTWFFRR